jgi:hypothetical protein
MTSSPAPTLDQDSPCQLVRFSRIPGLRALAWSGHSLYASRGYELVCANVQNLSKEIEWQPVARYRPSLRRRLSALNGLTARLFRDGFHALAILPAGDLVAAVPGAIIARRANDPEFHSTHTIIRGTRPLHITAVPGGAVFWGEYFDNASRDEVHIYASSDGGLTWNVAYTFPKGAIRHVHNIVHDRWQNCLWVLTGDYGDECRVLRAACDFSQVEIVLQGKQQARAVAAIPAADAIYFSSDTPLEKNYIYRLDHRGALSRLTEISTSSIYGCQAAGRLFFSTMVEPSTVNPDRTVRIYAGDSRNPDRWQPLLSWKKDLWPMGLFQYGNAFFPDGDNITPCLAVTTVAVEQDDMVTSIYSVGP